MGTSADLAPPEWTPGPVTHQERAYHVVQGGPAVLVALKGLLAVLKGLLVALGSALR